MTTTTLHRPDLLPSVDHRHRDRHQVVVVGSGFGGLAAARGLARADVDVTVVDRTPHHVFTPLLYQVATGVLSEGEVAPATREVLSHQDNATVLLGDVTDVDLAARTVTSELLGRRTTLHYDSLVVAAGAGQSYFGNDHFATHAPGLKTVDDALEVRGRVFGAFEVAELRAAAGEDVTSLLTFVVVGAGPTGVELAGQIAELARRTLRSDFRHISTARARVLLVDGGDQVLAPFGPQHGARAHRTLERIGVEVVLQATVTDVDARGLELTHRDGRTEQVAAETKIWAAGVCASPLARSLASQSGAPLDRAGRIEVGPALTLPGHPEVFVVGDMASRDQLPGVAQVAIQGGRYAAAVIDRGVRGDFSRPAFRYRDKGSMATISRFRAVATVGGVRIGGVLAWVLWLVVHLAFLTGFRNRVTAVLHWATSFLGRSRSERTVTEQQVFARSALALLPGGAADLVDQAPDEPTTDLTATTCRGA